MPSIGPQELLFVVLAGLAAAVPVASFVLVLLTYRKVSAIERRLAEGTAPRSV